MPRRSSKAAQILPIEWVPSGGLDLSRPPSQIADNALQTALNFFYDPNSQGVLLTRRGLRCVTSAPLASPILCLHHYVKSADVSHIVAAAGGKVWRLDDSGTGWVEVMSLPSADVIPQFLNFNGKLLVACGDTSGILFWDGSTTGTLTGSPKATAIIEAGNRVVANAMDEPDAVYCSGPENADDWQLTAPGAAAAFRAGFGDGLHVNGFTVLQDTLIVSKIGKASKTMYAYSMAGTPQQWQENRQLLTPGNAAVGPLAIKAVGDNVYYLDRTGAKRLVPPQLFGSITTDPLFGAKINRALARYLADATQAQISFLPSIASLVLTVTSPTAGYRCFVFSTTTGAFTEFGFGGVFGGALNSWIDADGVVMTAGESGFLYALDGEHGARDELLPGVQTEFAGILRSKAYRAGGHGLILRQTTLDIEHLARGELSLTVFGNLRVPLATYAAHQAGANTDIYDSTMPIHAASWAIGLDPVTELTSWSRVRSHKGLQFSVRTLGGARVGINGLIAETAITQR